uniref:DNA polymerase delta 4, accessory subunit n=1 Tax=Corvus moneduloides TaxID=1196302 RepID=A0A8C3DHK4_CORMO
DNWGGDSTRGQPGVSRGAGDRDHRQGGSGRDAPSQPPVDPALLEMLRRFDLSWEYGPCTGITRLQRWERAQELGLSPPGPIRDALLEHRDNPDAGGCGLW